MRVALFDYCSVDMLTISTIIPALNQHFYSSEKLKKESETFS